jgi:hypothetical protein
MTLKEAIEIILDELERNSLENQPFDQAEWDAALDWLKKELELHSEVQ